MVNQWPPQGSDGPISCRFVSADLLYGAADYRRPPTFGPGSMDRFLFGRRAEDGSAYPSVAATPAALHSLFERAARWNDANGGAAERARDFVAACRRNGAVVPVLYAALTGSSDYGGGLRNVGATRALRLILV